MKRYLAKMYVPANRDDKTLTGDPPIKEVSITLWATNHRQAEADAAYLADLLGGSEMLIDCVYELA